MNNKKCIIFGVGKIGNIAYRFLKSEYEIIGFADNNSKKWGEFFHGKLIYSPDRLNLFNDIVIIIATVYYGVIYEQLKRKGINNIWLFTYVRISENYKLCQLSSISSLFSDCILDRKKILEIETDFMQNYPLPHQGGKVVLETREKRNVLFCAYYFPPLGGAGVQRSLKFVKYLRKFGYEPIVLTVGINNGTMIGDSSMLDEVENDISVVRIDCDIVLPELMTKEEQQEVFNLYMGVMQSDDWIKEYKQFLQKPCSNLLPDNEIIWVNRCLKEIEHKIDLKSIDIIYTTGNPYSAFFLGYYIKKKYGIKWIMDYRDPWMSNDFYVENFHKSADEGIIKLQRQLENKLVSFSDYIIGAADLKKDLIDKYGILAEKFVEITNGYDEDDFRNVVIKETKNTKFTLCYNGNLYGERNPLYLLKIINYLIEEGKINNYKIRWIWNGDLEKRWKNLLDKEDKYGLIQYKGYLCHKDSITFAMNADLLLLFGYDGFGTDIGYCGKLFEYLRMNKPILSFSTKGGILDKVFQETHSGENFDYRDEYGITKYLLKVYYAWEQGIEIIHPNEEEIRKYDRENLTFKLASVFNEALESDLKDV